VVWIFDVIVNCTYIVVIHSVLNVVKIIMCGGHAVLTKWIFNLKLWVLSDVPQEAVKGIDLLSECLLSSITIDLSKLLLFEIALRNNVLLFLGKVSQVMSRRTCPDLTWWHSGSLWYISSSCNNSKALNNGTSSDRSSHSYITKAF